ncbi:MAG: FHA domain-containing protein [Pseudomonadota bacterium]
MLKLQFKDQRKPAIWLVESRYAIGKDPQNNIVLADEGISPFHAELRVEGDQVFISDTGSTSGTFVNGKRIQRRTELRASDVIGIHNIEFLLIDPKQEITPAPEGATAISPALANIPVAPSTASANKQGSGWVLKAKTGSIVGKTFPIPSVGKVVIGRANNCDIQLPANHVSRQHAEVQLVGGRLLVKDLNSSNGTYINRKKVSDGELKNGDEVRFDTFSFEVAGPAGNTTAQKPAAAPAEDDGEERTQFRGGAAVPAAATAKPKADAPRPSSTTATTTLQPKMPDEGKSGGGGGMILVVLVVAVLGGAAWFFLG